jgi:phosphoglycolate phosphatase
MTHVFSDIRGILFDKDGTLFDFHATWGGWTRALLDRLDDGDALRRAALARALGYDDDAGRFHPASPVIAGSLGELADLVAPHVVEAQRDGLVQRLGAMAAQANAVEAVALAPLLQRLRGAGLALGVATNDGEAPARAHLGDHAARFDFIAGYDSGFGAKPQPGMLLAFAHACRLDPRQVLMVGDSLHDLHAGRAAGMRTLGVLTGMATAGTLAPHADAVAPDIGHLPALLGLG